jgi:Ca2+:H+ antiporter
MAMSILDRIFYSLFVFVPVAIIASFLHASPQIIFILTALAIIPLAKMIGEATEEAAYHTGAAVGSLLNVTFGNATELIIGIFALQAGLIDVVKASIVGSILSNLLLVLGFAMLFGGYGRVQQKFNATAAKAAGTTLLLSMVALVVPALFVQTHPSGPLRADEMLSVSVSGLLIIAYIAGLFFSLRTHQHLYVQDVGKFEPKWSLVTAATVLIASTLVVAYMSEILVGSIQPLVQEFGWSQIFIGVIVLAIIGNAAEHASAVLVATRDKMDLALQIAIGSATQIGMFVAPVLVLLSLFFARPMNLIFDFFELAALILSVLVVNSVVEDGESNWLEGMQLIIAYLIIAAAFFLHA